MSTHARLEHDDLQRLVPVIQTGAPRERETAQLEMLAICEGLIRYWTKNMYSNMRAKLPGIDEASVRDIVVISLLRGLDKVDLGKVGTSPSNYLSTFVVGETKRELIRDNAERSRYFRENAARAHAIISRLTMELGRTPTDAEVITASGERTPTMRLGAKDRTGTTRAPLTASFLKTYHAYAAPRSLSDFDQDAGPAVDPTVAVEDRIGADALRTLYLDAARSGGVGNESINIVFCTFGIAPYLEPLDVAEVADKLGVTRQRVKEVLTAWTAWCRTPGSAFHAALSALDEDDAYALGLGPVLVALGPLPAGAAAIPPALAA